MTGTQKVLKLPGDGGGGSGIWLTVSFRELGKVVPGSRLGPRDAVISSLLRSVGQARSRNQKPEITHFRPHLQRRGLGASSRSTGHRGTNTGGCALPSAHPLARAIGLPWAPRLRPHQAWP